MTDISVRWVGVILGVNRFIRLASNTLAGQFVVRFGRRVPFVASLVVASVVCVSYGISSGVWPFVVARMLWGICWSFLRMEGMQTVLDLATPTTKGIDTLR